MSVQLLKDRFFAQERRTILFLRYVLKVQEIIPHLATMLSPEDRMELSSVIEEVVYLSREIFNLPDLGTQPPDPIPFDADCPEHLMSDHTRERIGRYTPLWDFANAPFTHPIGTELAVWCIDSQWNGYDTFINALLGEITGAFPDHTNVMALRDREQKMSQENPHARLTTETKLEILGIAVMWDEIRRIITPANFKVRAELAEDYFDLAKQLRSVRTHVFGEPSPWLRRFTETHPFDDYQVRILDNGEMEVTTVCSRNAIEAIKAKMLLIARKAELVYTTTETA